MRIHKKERLNSSMLLALLNSLFDKETSGSYLGDIGVCVMQDGKEIYKKYFGKCCDDTLFRIASMTKPITAVAVLIQVSRGLLDLDEPICKLLPEFNKAEQDKMLITPRMLLTHTSGVGTGAFFNEAYEKMLSTDKQDLEHVAHYISMQPLGFEPQTMQSYSPLWAFDILARLVEITSEKDFYTFLKDNIFTPCGMNNTTFSPTENQWANMVQMHDRVEQNGDFKNAVGNTIEGCVFGDIPTTWYCGGAGLASTLPDYVKFAKMLLSGGVTEAGECILHQNCLKQMVDINSNITVMSEFAHWGLGVRVITSDKHHMPKGSFGWSGAYGSHFWVDPENQIIAVLMRNSHFDGGGNSSISAKFEKYVYLALDN